MITICLCLVIFCVVLVGDHESLPSGLSEFYRPLPSSLENAIDINMYHFEFCYVLVVNIYEGVGITASRG